MGNKTDMNHKVKVTIETEKKGLFGKKKVLEKRWIEVDEKTYQKMLRDGEIKDDGLSAEDMVLMDWFLG